MKITTLLRLGRLALLVAAASAVEISMAQLAPPANPVPPKVTKDKVSSREGIFRNGSGFSEPAGGRSGQAGDYAANFPVNGSGPLYVQDAGFFNSAAANDAVSVAFWTRKYDIASGSAFWFNSPSSNNGQRGYQAHLPWGDNTIYFDSVGCCGGPQRINASIADFSGYTGDVEWWTNSWHHFVFSKQGEIKQIWIDGELFLEGFDSAPLPVDFTDLFIGSAGDGNGLFHGLMDDFAVFSSQLTPAQIQSIFTGTKPNALPAAAGLLAYWDFDDFPSEGQFASVSPTPNTTSANPNTITVVHLDGVTPWEMGNVSLTLNGVAVPVTFEKTGRTATVRHVSPTLWPIQSTQRAVLTYPGSAGPRTLAWDFTVGPYTTDRVSSRLGTLTGGSSFTPAGGGRSGAPGDYSIDFGRSGTGPMRVPAAFLNTASANDEMTFALWTRKYDIANGSVFWARSPSSPSGERGFQVHLPWSDNTIYFDTAGCCGSNTRLNDSTANFAGYTGETDWWTDSWHFFVFSKKGEMKQIWIDGELFLEGYEADPLPVDFTELLIGSEWNGAGLFRGLVDDFSIYSKQLTEAQIKSLYAGTQPSALPAAAGLMAHWDFNDSPPQGIFLASSPAPYATNADPNFVSIEHLQGSTPWDLSKVSLKVDGAAVNASVTRADGKVRVTYVPSPIFAAGSVHTATLVYPGTTGDLLEREWQFMVGTYTLDSVQKYVGVLNGAAKFTAAGGGRSGAPGDFAMDFGTSQAGQSVRINDVSFINAAAANDEMSVVGWQKLHSLANSAFFWATSPGSSGGQRGWGAFPWGNENIYFDTAGCCGGDTQRINSHIDAHAGYTDSTWWNEWRHFVYQKKGSTKEIWVDGQLLVQGDNTNPLPTDFSVAYIGFDVPDNARLQGIVDDFAVFATALQEADIARLASGTRPSALPASTRLVAYWDFDDGGTAVPANPPTLTVTRSGNQITLTYQGAIESAENATGPWTAVQNAASPLTISVTEGIRFYRARNN